MKNDDEEALTFVTKHGMKAGMTVQLIISVVLLYLQSHYVTIDRYEKDHKEDRELLEKKWDNQDTRLSLAIAQLSSQINALNLSLANLGSLPTNIGKLEARIDRLQTEVDDIRISVARASSGKIN
jgi:outer membrane murein-binding lipoprotein Lpp